MEDYQGYGKAKHDMYPSIGVPTTAGTGSEAQSYALITRSRDHLKMACGDPGVRFQGVILDPDLLETAPRQVLAVAAADALSHAVESLVSAASHPISRMFSCWSWKLLEPNCENAVKREESGGSGPDVDCSLPGGNGSRTVDAGRRPCLCQPADGPLRYQAWGPR